MAIISPSTFDPLKRYVAVRLQQGVPIVDADWNEADDVRRFELRAFLKWFVGDGVPEGSDGFRVIADDTVNDFLISSGVPATAGGGSPGAMQAGRCLVDGLDVLITQSIRFRSQPLHVSQGGAALAAAWGVPAITELGEGLPPTGIWPISIYLDVWERLVTHSEDPDLVFEGLGTESCARMRREWVVRWRVWDPLPAGTDFDRQQTVPSLGEPDYQAGHAYYSIATIVRNLAQNPGGIVHAADVTDLRERRLLLPPATLIEDTMGVPAPAYRINALRPVTNLRAAINALLRGDLPGTAQRGIEPNPGGEQTLIHSAVLDAEGGAIAVWTNRSFSSTDRQIHAARLDSNAIAAGYGSAVSVTSGIEHRGPSITRLPNGELVLMYLASTGDLLYQRGSFPWTGTETVIAGEAPADLGGHTVVATANDVLLFLYTKTAGAPPQYRRRRISDDAWLDSGPQPMTVGGLSPTDISNPVVDSLGRLWLAGASASGIQLAVMDIATGGLIFLMTPPTTIASDRNPFLVTADGNVCLFWGSSSRESLFGAMLSTTGSASITIVRQFELPIPGMFVHAPSAAQDGPGRLALYFVNTNVTAQPQPLQMVTLDVEVGTWGASRNIAPTGNNFSPFPLLLPNSSTLLHWGVNQAIQYKQVITQI